VPGSTASLPPFVASPARTIRLRTWQKNALDAFQAGGDPDFLAVATPGAGKTTFALTAARQALAAHPGRRLVVVAPTQHLKGQWAGAAERFGLHLDPAWITGEPLPPQVHGIVVTYQQVAQGAEAVRQVARDGFGVLDEVHHAGDDRAWGDGVRTALEVAAVRLSLSGTPFRSDSLAIPFVKYDAAGEAEPDIEYGYGPALADRTVVRPVHFPRLGGDMEWIGPDGSAQSASFDDALDGRLAAQRLRTALDVGGAWLPDALTRAHAQLMEIRASHTDAGGLVIAMDREHARGIAGIMRRVLGVDAVVATSDDPAAGARIDEFAGGRRPWLVAVRMVSEGVDIPRLRVGVFATTTTTELFFRQAVGRIVRYVPGRTGRQPSYMFMPDDPRLRAHAMGIAEERRHFLKKAGDEDDPRGDAALDEIPAGPEDEQLSLFSAVSATPSGEAAVHKVDETLGLFGSLEDDEPVEDGFELQLAEAPHLGTGGGGAAGGNGGAAADAPGLSPVARRRALRDANSVLVRAIAGATGMTHAQVNGELNRRSGVTRVAEADVQALERRRGEGARWLARIGSRSGT
jgi:superfamily II DNA or RNA helicase